MEEVVITGAISLAKLQSDHHHQQTNTQFFTGRMPFLSPNQQCQSTEGNLTNCQYWVKFHFFSNETWISTDNDMATKVIHNFPQWHFMRALFFYLCLMCFQDEMIEKYSLSSVTLEKFFLGPLPEFQASSSNCCLPTASSKPPAINGFLPVTDLHPANNTGVSIGVIDLTDDDFEVPTIQTSSAVAAKKHVETARIHVRKNHHIIKPSWLTCWFCFLCMFFGHH